MIDKGTCKTSEEADRERILENTSYYLENYLDPDRNWDRTIPPKQRINQIKYSNVNWKTISDHIKDMEYQDFLKTPYWKAIAAHTKYKAGYRCQLCNSGYQLVTHHRTYSIHGFEHDYMQELIVLCSNCHNKFHGQIPKSKSKINIVLAVLIVNLTVLSLFFTFFDREIDGLNAKNNRSCSCYKQVGSKNKKTIDRIDKKIYRKSFL